MVGGIATGNLEGVWQEALGIWRGLPGHGMVSAWLGEARVHARDLGEVQASLMLRAFGESGLVVLDPRLDQFRLAARSLYRRYLDHHTDVQKSVDRAGEALEGEGYQRAIPPLTSEFALYRIEDGARVKTGIDGARQAMAKEEPLTGNVVMRPVVQDALLPTVLQIAGPGEVAYLAQLGEVYKVLGVPPSVAFPRATATWLPETAVQLITERGVDAWSLVREPDTTLRQVYAGMVPEEARATLDRLRTETDEKLEEFAATVQGDRRIPAAVDRLRPRQGGLPVPPRRRRAGLQGAIPVRSWSSPGGPSASSLAAPGPAPGTEAGLARHRRARRQCRPGTGQRPGRTARTRRH